MDVRAEVQRAWADHGTQAEAVAARLSAVCEDVGPDEVAGVAGLVVHVFAEHLGRPAEGLRLLERLGRHGPRDVLWRCEAVLRLFEGDGELAGRCLAQAKALGGGQEGSHDARVHAIAASAVAAHGRIAEAAEWLLLAAGATAGLPDADPAVRSVAVTANNLAVTLEAKPDRSPAEDDLLRRAARIARLEWARAGSWVEVERAEYRLAMSHLALGEFGTALEHANACVAVCEANGADAGERFFAAEAVARVRHALGDAEGACAARDEAEAQLAQIEGGLRGYAQSVLAGLDRALGR